MGIPAWKEARILWILVITLYAFGFACAACQGSQSKVQVDAGTDPPDASPNTNNNLDVDRNLYLDELTEEDLRELCEWMVAIQGGPHSVDCGDGVMVTIDRVDDCLAQPYWPHCPVGLHAKCVETQATDLCAAASLECEQFYECVYGI